MQIHVSSIRGPSLIMLYGWHSLVRSIYCFRKSYLLEHVLLLICNAKVVQPSNIMSSVDNYKLGMEEKIEGNLIFHDILSSNTEVSEKLILRYCEFLYKYTFRMYGKKVIKEHVKASGSDSASVFTKVTPSDEAYAIFVY